MSTPIPSASEHGWPFATGAGQVVTTDHWETMASTWQVSGVVGYPETTAAPSTGNRGLYATRISETQVEIQPGVATIAGHYYELKATKTVDLDITGTGWDSGGIRRDMLTLRLDRSTAGFRFVQVKGAINLTAQTLTLESAEEIPLVQLDITNGSGLMTAPVDRRWYLGKHVRPIRGGLSFLDPVPRNGEFGVDTTNNYLVVGQGGQWVPAAQVFNNDLVGPAVTALQGRVTALENDPGAPRVLTYSVTGPLSVATGKFKLYNDSGYTWTIVAVRATVGTAPSGGGVRVDVNKNGTSVFASTGTQPTIASGTTTAKVTAFATTSVADGEYVTVDVDTIGAGTTPGRDLVVQVAVS